MERVEDKLTINKAFAAKYKKKKEAEELSRRKFSHSAMHAYKYLDQFELEMYCQKLLPHGTGV